MTNKLYDGYDTSGSHVQVAVNANGNAFSRRWVASSYGYRWSKWCAFAATFPTVVNSKIDGMEHVEYQVEAGTRVAYGFVNLPLVATNARIRLPR